MGPKIASINKVFVRIKIIHIRCLRIPWHRIWCNYDLLFIIIMIMTITYFKSGECLFHCSYGICLAKVTMKNVSLLTAYSFDQVKFELKLNALQSSNIRNWFSWLIQQLHLPDCNQAILHLRGTHRPVEGTGESTGMKVRREQFCGAGEQRGECAQIPPTSRWWFP